MTLRVRRLLLALAVIGLVATGCGSSDSGSSEAADDNAAATPDATEPDGDDAAADPNPTATSIPLPETDSAADTAIAGLDGEAPPVPADADPRTTAQDFVRARFNIDPEPEWVGCMVAETARDEVLELALRTPAVALGEVDDTELESLTYAMNGCVDTRSLADWATQAIGPQGEVQETAPPCLVERFDAEPQGDTIFYNFVALTYQFRLDPEGIDGLVDTLSECAPITSLAGFFASQAEQSNNFETLVDRDCLDQVLSPPEVSREFWDVFVGGGMPPVEVIAPFTDQCGFTPNSDLAATIPADFEPWAGTGTLAQVRPQIRNRVYTEAPPMDIDPDARYEAILVTGGGEIRIELYADVAPITVNSFVQLARDGFYDRTVFHRVLDGFMAQAGDPTGTGTGGPGYQFDDEIDPDVPLDRKGLVAMANTGPDSNGSQFFITFGPTDWLTGNHTLFGEVIDGIEVVEAIERRDPLDPQGPGQVLESVTIIETPSE